MQYQFDKILTVETVLEDLEKWEAFSEHLKNKLKEANFRLGKDSNSKLEKKIRKERQKLDKLDDAPMDIYSEEWYEELKSFTRWKKVDYIMDRERKCSEESCNNYTAETGKHNNENNSFYRAYGDDSTLLCNKHYSERTKDGDILWAVRELRYTSETRLQKEKRCWNRDEWYEDTEEVHDCHDISCILRDTCWYQGNLDRLGEYGTIYVLRGTNKEVIICDICFQNGDYKYIEKEDL